MNLNYKYVAIASLIIAAGFLVFPSRVYASERICEEYTAKVKLTAISITKKDLKGTLCYKGNLEGKPLQLTVHGITYNRNYFNFSYNDYQYSYQNYAVDQGYAVLNIDRIGNGESSIPNGLLVDLNVSAYTIHQLIEQLRDGSLTGTAFDTIIYVGHSYGSFTGVRLASTYQDDVDGLVLTGYLHNINPDALALAPTSLVPTQLDPKFGLFFPTGYLTTAAGSRVGLFYNTAVADAAVIAQDELEKDVLSVTTVSDIVLAVASPESLNINKPVQIVIGDEDFLFCGGLVDCHTPSEVVTSENSKFGVSADLEVSIIPEAGHDLNLHTNFMDTYESINDWIGARF